MAQLGTELKAEFDQNGIVYFEPDTSCFSQQDIDELERLCAEIPIERVVTGDAGEPNHVDVGRFVTDVERPELVNRPLSDRALEIVMKDAAKQMYADILGTDQVFLRRMQVNKFGEDCFVGMHLDTDSNPDYKFACIIQLGDDFDGGEFAVYKDDALVRSIKPEYRSLTISNSSFPHEVQRVTRGQRASLVFFIGDNDGDNKTPPPPSVIES